MTYVLDEWASRLDPQLPDQTLELGIIAMLLMSGPLLIGLYMLVNVIRTVIGSRDSRALQGVAVGLLGIGSAGLLLVSILLEGILWGFWLTWVGIVSSATVEGMDWLFQIEAAELGQHRKRQAG